MCAQQNKHKRTTSIELAKYLGVSVSTVSRALNDRSDISKETQARVLKAARELNYTPNETARNLVTQTNKTIAAFLPDIQNPYFSEIIKSIDKVLRQNNYSLTLCITNEIDEEVDYYLEQMLKKRISGIILLSTTVKNKQLLEKVLRNTALVSVSANNEGADQIVNEDETGTYNIVRHLIELGHKRVAFVGYKTDENKTLYRRLCGYRKAMKEQGLYDESLVIEAKATDNPGYEAVSKILSLPALPTAIHCMNEYLAMGMYHALEDAELNVPGDISLSAFDGLEITRLVRPKLTTVVTPISKLGKTAAELLMQRIRNEKRQTSETIVFESHLFVGDSTSSPQALQQ